jgi:hypothetical protein
MAVRMTKPWLPLSAEVVDRVGGYMGIYQIQSEDGATVYMGSAGGRSLFGLRGELERELKQRGPGHRFRYEVNVQYTSRLQELLMVHVADHGQLPRDNRNMRGTLGRLSPS